MHHIMIKDQWQITQNCHSLVYQKCSLALILFDFPSVQLNIYFKRYYLNVNQFKCLFSSVAESKIQKEPTEPA